MSFDFQLLGKKLREARESLLVEVEEAAQYLNISVQDYLQIETGALPATGDQVILLAILFRRDFRYFVTGDYPSAESQIQEMFRRNAALSKRDRIAIQEFSRLCEYEAFLENLLSIQQNQIPDYSKHPFGHGNYKQQGKEAAILERDRLRLDSGAIADIFRLVRGQGVHLFKRKLEDRNISGLYLFHPTAGHCVLVNYLDDLYRQNFSAAHEYSHALFDSAKEQQVSYVRGTVNERGLEWRANSFAGNLLVPGELIEQGCHRAVGHEEWVDLIRQIALRCHVNAQVAVIRLQEMGWISKELQAQLARDKRLTIHSDAKVDPEIPDSLSVGQKERLTEAIRHGLSWHFLELCAQAYRAGEVTYHKVLEMLFLPMDQGTSLLSTIPLFVEVESA